MFQDFRTSTIMKHKIFFIVLYAFISQTNAREFLFKNKLGRLFETTTRTSASVFKNCTVSIVTTGEVCQNNWPIFDVALANLLSAKHQAMYKAMIDDFDIIGLVDGKIFGEGITGETSLTPTVTNVDPINCLDEVDEGSAEGSGDHNEFGHWLVCRSDINCPVVRVASRNELCHFWSYYGGNPGFVDHSLKLAPHQAVVRDQFVWKQQLSEYDIAAYANGYVTGFGYDYQIVDEDTTRQNSSFCQLTDDELKNREDAFVDGSIRDDWGHWLVCDMSEGFLINFNLRFLP